MTTEQESTQSAQPKRPGLPAGVCSEFTILANIKPGQAEAMRAAIAAVSSEENEPASRAALQEIGTLHDARHVIFDNDTRYLFASVFDGSWDTYIDDFAKTAIGANLDRIFSNAEGFPGIADPNVKDWVAAHQESALGFASSYPDLTVQQIWKDQRANQAFQEVLDTPEFRAALDNPANAALLATPAFQKLLDQAQG
ncbi:MAG: hypothetical protein QOH19_575 [Actinomycetota bacterium]|jgi:hypothetical protein|nr:hypothetical protein [Actinomycetota bacterium]